MTKLDKPIKREVTINGEPHVLTIAPEGLTITKKRGRLGKPVTWAKVQHMIDLEGAAE